MNIKEGSVLLIDAMNLIHRSYFAYPKFKSKEGIPTGAFYGFVKYLKSLQDKFNPSHMIVCSDAHRKSFRMDIYEDYKGTRGETDDELKIQFQLMENYLSLCCASFIKMDNYEADDLIGTLAKGANDYGYFSYIVSGDRDLFQLIDSNTHQIYLSNKGMITFDEEGIKEKYNGLNSSQIVDMKALSGDTSDNIPGVRGIGEKTAITLLNKYSTLDGIYENIDKIKGKRQERLIEDKEKAYLSKELATIHVKVPIDIESLFNKDENFSLCTKEAYEYVESLNIKIFNKDDIRTLKEI